MQRVPTPHFDEVKPRAQSLVSALIYLALRLGAPSSSTTTLYCIISLPHELLLALAVLAKFQEC